jgi:DNA-binding LacI/PurR family transcriptional regulator
VRALLQTRPHHTPHVVPLEWQQEQQRDDGCDDLPLAARTIPPLTTVRVPLEQLRELATSLLLDLIRTPSAPPQQIVLPVSPVYRASSGRRVMDDW